MKTVAEHAPSRKGFSLIEAAIVLAIVGLVIGGLWVAASAVSARWKLSEMTKGLGYANARLRQLAPSLGSSAVTLISWNTRTGPGVNMNILPQDWVVAGLVVPPYSEIFEFGISYNGSDTFQYTVGGLSYKSCTNLLPVLAYSMKLGGTISPSGASWGPTRTMAETLSYCGGTNTIYIQVPI